MIWTRKRLVLLIPALWCHRLASPRWRRGMLAELGRSDPFEPKQVKPDIGPTQPAVKAY